jgi:hypothetical protein
MSMPATAESVQGDRAGAQAIKQMEGQNLGRS